VSQPETADVESAGEADTSPLYVDLDDTLVATDTLWESIWAFLRTRPASAWKLVAWRARGRAAFGEALASAVVLDPASLPYRAEVVEYLRSERSRGRAVILATSAAARVAHGVADHLGLFDAVLATSGGSDPGAAARLEAIEHHRSALPGGGFEYVGHSAADLPVWRRAARVTAVGPGAELGRELRRLDGELRVLPGSTLGWRALVRAVRVHQWAKNALVFAPLLLAHYVTDPHRIASVALTFACFCAIASSTYLLNDLLDIEADRHHPRKRRRPIASGALPIPKAMALSAGLLVAGLGVSLAWLRPGVSAMLGVYLALTLGYSLYLKRLLFMDVLVLAGLYTHRILTGGVAADALISPWLLAFSTFFFLSLALVKRYVELPTLEGTGRDQLSGRAYEADDLALVGTMGVTSGYISILVLALYVNSEAVRNLYRTPELVWAICPVMLYWITRIWFLARRGRVTDDPVLFATTDAVSWVSGAVLAAVLVAAALL